MFYVIILMLIGLAFLIDDIKSRVDIVIILFLCFVVAANINNSDYFWYNQAYEMLGRGLSDSPSLFETGWNILNRIGNVLGLTYNGFIAVVMFIGLMLMRSTAKYYSGNRNVIWGLYAVFPAVLYCVQVRSFASAAVIIFALKFLSQRKLKRIFVYVLLVLLASELHVTALAFLPFALAPFIPPCYKKAIVGSIFALTMFLLSQAGSLSRYLLDFVGNDRGSYYENFFQNTKGDIPFRCVVLLVGCFAVVWFIGWRIGRLQATSNHKLLSPIQQNYLWLVQLMTLVSFLLIPLLLYAADFMRLQRVLIFPIYVLFGMYLAVEPKGSMKAISFGALIVTAVAGYWFLVSGSAENTTFALLDFQGMPPLFK